MINQKMAKGNKHIMNRYYFVKDYYKKGIINLSYIPTKDNLADIFTKPLKRDIFENIRNRIMGIKTKAIAFANLLCSIIVIIRIIQTLLYVILLVYQVG